MDDYQDKWLIEAANVAEANIMLENAETAIAESTSESKKSTDQSELPNPEMIDIYADVDDNWLIEVANIAEANLILKTTEAAIGESTSGSKQSTEQYESTNPEMIDIYADVDDNWLIEAANIAEANLILKTTEAAIGESTSESKQSTEQSESTNPEMIAVNAGTSFETVRRNPIDKNLNLHDRPKRFSRQSEKSMAVSEQKKDKLTKKPKGI